MKSGREEHTAQIMRAKDAMVRAQEGERRALRQNGELRARLALLETIIEGYCDANIQHQHGLATASRGTDREMPALRLEGSSPGLNARAMGSASGGGA